MFARLFELFDTIRLLIGRCRFSDADEYHRIWQLIDFAPSRYAFFKVGYPTFSLPPSDALVRLEMRPAREANSDRPLTAEYRFQGDVSFGDLRRSLEQISGWVSAAEDAVKQVRRAESLRAKPAAEAIIAAASAIHEDAATLLREIAAKRAESSEEGIRSENAIDPDTRTARWQRAKQLLSECEAAARSWATAERSLALYRLGNQTSELPCLRRFNACNEEFMAAVHDDLQSLLLKMQPRIESLSKASGSCSLIVAPNSENQAIADDAETESQGTTGFRLTETGVAYQGVHMALPPQVRQHLEMGLSKPIFTAADIKGSRVVEEGTLFDNVATLRAYLRKALVQAHGPKMQDFDPCPCQGKGNSAWKLQTPDL